RSRPETVPWWVQRSGHTRDRSASPRGPRWCLTSCHPCRPQRNSINKPQALLPPPRETRRFGSHSRAMPETSERSTTQRYGRTFWKDVPSISAGLVQLRNTLRLQGVLRPAAPRPIRVKGLESIQRLVSRSHFSAAPRVWEARTCIESDVIPTSSGLPAFSSSAAVSTRTRQREDPRGVYETPNSRPCLPGQP